MKKQNKKPKGRLLVVTGYSGAGKDSVIDLLIDQLPHFRRLVTCADRPARPGEIHGVHYYFVNPEEMDRMHSAGELVEKPLTYGVSRKATPRHEFESVLRGESLIWRIESSLAAHVASGGFFDEQFPKQKGKMLREMTTVIFITASKKDLLLRRRRRDGKHYNVKDFAKRDGQDKAILAKYGKVFGNIIENEENRLSETVDKVLKLIKTYPIT